MKRVQSSQTDHKETPFWSTHKQVKNNTLMSTVWVLSLMLLVSGCGSKVKNDVPVAKVKKGVFYLDIHEEGEINATRSTSISTPNISWRYGSLKITQLVEDGSEVKQGDTVAVFDPSEIKKGIADAEAKLEINKAEMEKLQAQQQSDIEEMKSDLEVTRLSQEISKITFESASYEAEIKRKEIKLNLEKANIALEQAQKQMENKLKIQQEEVKQKKLAINQAEAELAEANETMAKLFLISPSQGIAIINKNWSSDNKFQVGDQCWSGFPLIDLPNLSELKATVQINEVDISKIVTGLKVEIRPDAFSDSVYEGEVISVANLAITKQNSKIKVFPVDILIRNKNSSMLPGLTVSCRIIIDKIDNVYYIPQEALFSEAGEDFVFVKKGASFEKRTVETGDTNTDYVVINKGLEEGDEVALSDIREKEEGKNKTAKP